ncbi:hypothetical protein, partial [Bacteroides heparinolyticus]|uniref:hypothetical protein n=2 Tax=Prevotella heparinolytica TaxID=28113 RepID=UPI0035A0A9C3
LRDAFRKSTAPARKHPLLTEVFSIAGLALYILRPAMYILALAMYNASLAIEFSPRSLPILDKGAPDFTCRRQDFLVRTTPTPQALCRDSGSFGFLSRFSNG